MLFLLFIQRKQTLGVHCTLYIIELYAQCRGEEKKGFYKLGNQIITVELYIIPIKMIFVYGYFNRNNISGISVI